MMLPWVCLTRAFPNLFPDFFCSFNAFPFHTFPVTLDSLLLRYLYRIIVITVMLIHLVDSQGMVRYLALGHWQVGPYLANYYNYLATKTSQSAATLQKKERIESS